MLKKRMPTATTAIIRCTTATTETTTTATTAISAWIANSFFGSTFCLAQTHFHVARFVAHHCINLYVKVKF